MDREQKIRRQQGERLRRAREVAGYKSARDAALSNHWPESSYRAHENGTRTIGQDDAERYAKRFRSAGVDVSAKTILFDDDDMAPRSVAGEPLFVPVVGYVGAGQEAHFEPVDLDEVPAPEGSTEHTVAVVIRGDSMGSFFDGWLVFYDNVQRPVTHDLIGKICVVGLVDGRTMIKKLQRSKTKGLFHLLSQNQEPIMDVPVEWAALVKTMVPR